MKEIEDIGMGGFWGSNKIMKRLLEHYQPQIIFLNYFF